MNTQSNKQLQSILFALLTVTVGVAFDQWTKHMAVLHLKGKSPFIIWKGVFQLYYLDNGNTGAAFGLFQGGRIYFLIITCIVVVLLCVLYFKMPASSRFIPLRICMILITSGAIGNMIDRFRLSYVVDFFYFNLIDFPIFNVADIYVTVSTILFALLITFYYKEEDFTWLKSKKN